MAKMPGNNLTAKILAVIMAIILWMYVMNEQNPSIESSFIVPLEVRNLASNYVAPDTPETVRIKLRGPRNVMAGVAIRDLKAYVDAKGLNEGRHNLKVQTVVPASLDVVNADPTSVQLVIDMITKRQLPVEVRLSGTTTNGVTVAKTSVSPNQVTIEGPRRLVDAVEKAVAHVGLGGKNVDFTAAIPVTLLGSDGQGIEGLTVYSDKVNVAVTLAKVPEKKTVEIKAILYGDLPNGVTLKRLKAEPPKVDLTGTKEALDKIEFVYTEPINVTGVGKDTTRDVKLQLPEGIIAAKDPVTVTIFVETKG